MDVTGSSLFSLARFMQKLLSRESSKQLLLTSLFAGTSCVLVAFLFPLARRKFDALWIARHNRLPIGLPNSRNLCYLNSLLQAMAANRSLVKSLKRSAAIRRDRLLCCLVALLEGLRCSASYLKKHNLVEVLTEAHRTLVAELALTDKWAVCEQQDVHELFSFFMELANGHEIGRTALRANEGLHSVSRFLCRSEDMSVARCCHRNSAVLGGLKTLSGGGGIGRMFPDALRQAQYHTLRMITFQHHLLANQIICSRCPYRGNIKLIPEACITLFPSEHHDAKLGKKKRKSKISPADVTIENLLAAQFRTAEKLTGVHCPRCHIKSLMPPIDLLSDTTPLIDKRMAANLAERESRNTCYCRRWVAHLPPCLVIYLQRAVWLKESQLLPNSDLYVYGDGGVTSKYSKHVRFPLHLDMDPYLCSGRVSGLAIKQQQQMLIAENSTLVANDDVETQIPSSNQRLPHNEKAKVNGVKTTPRRYVLRSVVVHQGDSLQAGHYIAYRGWRKHVGDDGDSSQRDWLFTSDRYVSSVSLASVLSTQAYMLFYECEPSSPQLELGNLSRSSSVAGRSVHRSVDADDDDDDDTSMIVGCASDSEDDDFAEDYEDEEEALDVFDGLSKAMRIRTLALAAGSQVC